MLIMGWCPCPLIKNPLTSTGGLNRPSLKQIFICIKVPSAVILVVWKSFFQRTMPNTQKAWFSLQMLRLHSTAWAYYGKQHQIHLTSTCLLATRWHGVLFNILFDLFWLVAPVTVLGRALFYELTTRRSLYQRCLVLHAAGCTWGFLSPPSRFCLFFSALFPKSILGSQVTSRLIMVMLFLVH